MFPSLTLVMVAVTVSHTFYWFALLWQGNPSVKGIVLYAIFAVIRSFTKDHNFIVSLAALSHHILIVDSKLLKLLHQIGSAFPIQRCRGQAVAFSHGHEHQSPHSNM